MTVEMHTFGSDYEVLDAEQQIVITFHNLKESRSDGTKAEVLVETLAADNDSRGYLARDAVTMTSSRSWHTLAGALATKYPLSTPDSWPWFLAQASELVLKHYRTGEPLVEIGDMLVGPRQMLVNGVLVAGHPNLLVGDAEATKSLTALALGLHIDNGLPFLLRKVVQAKTILLDWELTDVDQDLRVKDLCAGLGWERQKLLYRFCGAPLADDLDTIGRMVSESGAKFIIVDSVGLAVGGDMVGAEGALRFFQALRTLKVTSLLIHHNNKSKDNKGSYGSVYFRNLSRIVWECNARTVEETTRVIDFYNTKANLGPRLRAFSLRYEFFPGRIEIRETERTARPVGTIVDRITEVLRELGPTPIPLETITHKLQGNPDSIRVTLSASKDKFSKEGDGWVLCVS